MLGDEYAAHDVVVKSTNGSFYGIGKGIAAGNDVNVSVGDAVYYIGGTDKALYAGHDIIIETNNPTSDDAGIYIGALPDNINLMDVMNGTASVEEAPTKLWAGNNANFNVNGNGDIDLEGDVIAEAGKVSATVAGKGDITVGNEKGDAKTTIMAQKDVTLKTKEGDIEVSKGIQSTEESVSVQTGKGNIAVGRASKNEGEIIYDGETIKANKNVTVGTDLGTIYIQGETSTTTGDITMTAGKDTYEQGTGAGNFIIRDDGKLNSGGGVVLNGRNGDIEITDDIQAAKGITVNIAEQGNASFGRDVSVTNDVNISTDKGTITVGHTVNSDDGSVNLHSGNGDVLVGKDITAGKDVSISSQQGDVLIGDPTTGDYGDVLAKNGDVSIQAGQDVVIVKTITAQGQEGDIDIASGQGDIIVGNTVSSDEGNVSLQTGNGDVLVGQDITAGQGVSITSQQGDVLIGDPITGNDGDVLAKKGDVSIQTGQGYVGIVKTVTAQQGSIDIESGKGDILIGNNGPDDETVTAKQNVTLETANGKITVDGKTSTTDGDITLKAASETYVKGTAGQNIIINNDGITHNGIVDSGRDATLIAVNSDLQVTDNVKAKGSLNSKTQGMGNIILAKNINTEKEVSLQSDTGDITVGKNITANSVTLATGTGNITVGEDDGSGQKVGIITADNDVNINTGIGDVKIETSVESKAADVNVNVSNGNIHIGNNGPGVETVTAYKNIDIGVEQGQIEIYGKTSTKTGNISLSAAESQYIPGGQNIIIAQNGELDSAQDARLTGRNGDLRVTDAVKATRNLEVTVLDEG